MRRRSAALLLAAIALVAAPAGGDRRADLEELRSAIEQGRQRVAEYERKQRGLLETLESLDQAAELLSRDARLAREHAEAARGESRRLDAEVRVVEERVQATRRALRGRAVALYRAGELGALRLLFSAQALPEFLSRMTALRRLLHHDAELLAQHRAASRELAAALESAREADTRLGAAEAGLAERVAELRSERRRRSALIERVHDDRARERGALVELEKAARALEETLERLGDDPEPAGRPVPGPPFLTLRGKLDPPTRGEVVEHYGRVIDASLLTKTFRNGWTFEAPRGTPVTAVAGGQVRLAGWFRGYGKLVILDHGDDYFTVSGHLDEIHVDVGDAVQAGQAFGALGETGSLAGPRLYFEIRQGSQALDPADWLKRGASR